MVDIVSRLRNYTSDLQNNPNENRAGGMNDPMVRAGLGILSAIGWGLHKDQQAAALGSAALQNIVGRMGPTQAALASTIPVYGTLLSGIATGSKLLPFVDRQNQAAVQGFDQAQGNLVQRLLASNEAAAGRNRFLQGGINAVMDPMNALALGGPLAEAPGAIGKIGRALEFADKAQAIPFKPLGPLARMAGQQIDWLSLPAREALGTMLGKFAANPEAQRAVANQVRNRGGGAVVGGLTAGANSALYQSAQGEDPWSDDTLKAALAGAVAGGALGSDRMGQGLGEMLRLGTRPGFFERRALARGGEQAAGEIANLGAGIAPQSAGNLTDRLAARTRQANLGRFMEGAHPLLLNEDGSPKMLFHGTGAGNFDQFNIGEKPGDWGRGAYFTEDPNYAKMYAGQYGGTYGIENAGRGGEAGPNLKPVYANLRNPYIWGEMPSRDQGLLDTYKNRYAVAEAIQRAGHDGIIVPGGTFYGGVITPGGENQIEEMVVFDPATSVKSATGNIGTYDRSNPSLLASGLNPQAIRDMLSAAGRALSPYIIGEDAAQDGRLARVFGGYPDELQRWLDSKGYDGVFNGFGRATANDILQAGNQVDLPFGSADDLLAEDLTPGGLGVSQQDADAAAQRVAQKRALRLQGISPEVDEQAQAAAASGYDNPYFVGRDPARDMDAFNRFGSDAREVYYGLGDDGYDEVVGPNGETGIKAAEALVMSAPPTADELSPTFGSGVQDYLDQSRPLLDQEERDYNLQQWHKGSSHWVTNPDGTPKTFYHGTGVGDFPQFNDPEHSTYYGRGVYLTEVLPVAEGYAEEAARTGKAGFGGNQRYGQMYENIKPVYANVKNPYVLGSDPQLDELIKQSRWKKSYEQGGPDSTAKLERLGYDGIVVRSDRGWQRASSIYGAAPESVNELIVFRAQNIKSATGNLGTFDPNQNSLLYSGLSPQSVAGAAKGLTKAAGRAIGRAKRAAQQVASLPGFPPGTLEQEVGQAGAATLRRLFSDPRAETPLTDDDLVRVIRGGRANKLADNFDQFVSSNWARAQQGLITADDVINAYIPAILSQQRGGMKPSSVLGSETKPRQMREVAPILGQLTDTLSVGGKDAGKMRPEDIASYMIHWTDEGQSLAAALKYGDPDALDYAIDKFNEIWPWTGISKAKTPGGVYEREALQATATRDMFRDVALVINRMVAEGKTGDDIAEAIRSRSGLNEQGQKIFLSRINEGKGGFVTTNIGLSGATQDVRVKKTMFPGAKVSDYVDGLNILFPGDNTGLAHHKFWDAMGTTTSGINPETPHMELATAIKRMQQGHRFGPERYDYFGAGISPQQIQDAIDRFKGRFVQPVDKTGLKVPNVGPSKGTPKQWTPRQNALIDEIMAIKKARAPQDKLDLRALSLDAYARSQLSGDGFDDLWQTLVDNLRESQVLEFGTGSDIAEMRRTVESGLGRRPGFDPALGGYDELINRKLGRVRKNMSREGVESFVDVEGRAHANTGAGDPLIRNEQGKGYAINPEAVPPMYASLTPGTPSGMEMGGTFRQLLDKAKEPRYLVPVHHHYMTAAPEVESFHASGTPEALQRLWGPENQLVRDLLGRGDRVPVGDTGNTMLDTPLFVHPDAGPEAGAAMLILSAPAEELARAKTDPVGAAYVMLRGNAMRGNRSGSERLVSNLGGIRNVRRTEALLFDQDPAFLHGMVYAGGTSKEEPKALGLIQRYLNQFGQPDAPIYRMLAPEGAEPNLLPAEVSPGRAHIVEQYRKVIDPETGQPFTDLGAGIGPGAVGRMLRGAGGGTAIGAGMGAAYGYQADDENPLRGAAKGALAGGIAGTVGQHLLPELGAAVARGYRSAAPGVVDNTVLDPKALALAHEMAVKAMEVGRNADGAKLADLPRAIDDAWRAQVVNTMRGLGLDAVSLRILVEDFGRDYGVTPATVKTVFGDLLDHAHDADPIDRLGRPGQFLKSWGLDRFVDKETGLEQVIGSGFAGAESGARAAKLSGPQRVATGALLSFANLRDWVVPVGGTALSMARQYYAPYIDTAYRTLNGLQHSAPRLAFWTADLARQMPVAQNEFLDTLAKVGIDLPAMRGVPTTRADFEKQLAAKYRGLTPQEVSEFGQNYDDMLEAHAMKSADRVAHIFGDFRDEDAHPWKKFLARVFPFSRYALAYAPVWAEQVKRHPFIAAGVAAPLVGSALAVHHNNEQPWNAGTIPVRTDMPLVGPLAKARLGGEEGTVRLNPVGQFTGPVGADLFAGMPNQGANATPYDNASAVIDKLGFSPHPAIDALMGILGQSSKTVSPLDRMAGVEQSTELVPGMPTLPSAQGGYNNLKGLVTGQPVEDFDRIARRYGELYLEEHGHTLDDTGQGAGVAAIGNVDDPLWRQARQEVRLNDLIANVLSLTQPVSSSGQTRANERYQRQRAALPSQQQLQSAGAVGNWDEFYRLQNVINQARNNTGPMPTPELSQYAISSTADRQRYLTPSAGSVGLPYLPQDLQAYYDLIFHRPDR